jgi:hypothetical protein
LPLRNGNIVLSFAGKEIRVQAFATTISQSR